MLPTVFTNDRQTDTHTHTHTHKHTLLVLALFFHFGESSSVRHLWWHDAARRTAASTIPAIYAVVTARPRDWIRHALLEHIGSDRGTGQSWKRALGHGAKGDSVGLRPPDVYERRISCL